MDQNSRQDQITEEAFMILHAGEIPEVSYHSSLYYLREDPDGPALELREEDIIPLQQAVVGRYRTIILRDLAPENRDKRIYRGLARCAANWQRLADFCDREHLNLEKVRLETAEALQTFLQREMADVLGGKRASSINCGAPQVEKLAEALGLAGADLPEGWHRLCPDGR